MTGSKLGYLPCEAPMYKDSPARIKKMFPHIGTISQKNAPENKFSPNKNRAMKAT
jgi:hypothetical protein